MKQVISLLLLLPLLLCFCPMAFAKALTFGDVSLGGSVDLTDAKLVFADLDGLQKLTDSQKTAADVNFDGKISILDGLLILQYAEGLISVLGSGKILPATEKETILSVGESQDLLVFIPTTLPQIRWANTDSAVITISQTGEICAKKAGNAHVNAALPDNKQNASFSIQVEAAGIARGMDVSEFQGGIDWSLVRKDGKIDFAFLRIGYATGDRCVLDRRFEGNYKLATVNRIPIGVYLYAVPNSVEEAKIQALWVADRLKEKSLSLPVVMDLEDASLVKFGRRKITDMAVAFLNTLSEKGLHPMLYTYADFLEENLDATRLKSFDFWIADYGKTPPKSSLPYQYRQYSDRGRVAGIRGVVDLDYGYTDFLNVETGKD